MFGKLKDKLKSWIKKTEEDEDLVEKVEVKKDKKEKKKKDSKKNKEKKKDSKKEKKAKESKEKKKKKDKAKVKPQKIDEVTEEPEEIIEELVEEAETEAEEIIEEEEVEEIEENEPEEEKPEKKVRKGFFARFKKELSAEKFDELFEELEMILLQSNVAYSAVDSIRESLKESLVGKSPDKVDLEEELKNSIRELLINPPNFLEQIREGVKEKKPFVIVFCGINGSGKTTSIAKVADYLQKNKISVCLAAADTFRAAALEQIGQHADNLGVHLVKKDYGSDPASVGFDAINYAKKNNIDCVLIDTAGRMQNKDSLMREMEKIARVNSPDMRIFLGESITGNDATEQAKAFNDAIDLTGIILSKADVDEQGGTAISVSHVTGKPILFLGTGQEYKDLEIFDKDSLIEKLGL